LSRSALKIGSDVTWYMLLFSALNKTD